jgi:hypothetical protein
MGELLTPERLWSIPRVGTPAVSAGRVVVPVTTYDLDDNKGPPRCGRCSLTDGLHGG